MRRSASEVINDLENRVDRLEGRTASKVLSVAVMSVFTDELANIASDRALSDAERKVWHEHVSRLMREVNSVVKDHQSKVRDAGKDLFELANIVNKLSS